MNAFPAELRLTGHGLVLREWTDEDLAAMVELFDNPDIAYRTPLVSPFNLAAAHDYLCKARQGRAEDRSIHLAITTDGGQPLGEVVLARKKNSIGYAIGVAHRGQRLAVRAVRVMTDYAHQVAAMPRVLLEIEADNHPSISVARGSGYHLTDAPLALVEDKGRSLALLTWAHDAP
jgi:RimJ/RimL family protein N-acetyltransferase